MEFSLAEVGLTEHQEGNHQGPQQNHHSPKEHTNNKHHLPDEENGDDTTIKKKPKLEEEDDNLECLKNLCEIVAENGNLNLPDSQPPTEQCDSKSEAMAVKKKRKKKKKKVPAEEGADVTASGDAKSEANKKQGKAKHLRKNIREILKDDELEAETRAAQQRELERVQRLQQQQQRQQQQQQLAQCDFIPSFDVEDDSNPTSTLVEDLQALAQELEDSTLSPEMPLDFLNTIHEQKSSPPPADLPSVQGDSKPVQSKAEDLDDVICLSSDEELPPRPVPPSMPTAYKPFVPYDDDDDDVVILSGDDEKTDVGDDEEGDVHNFGLHTRDELNQPNGDGQVLVNVGHPPNESDIFLAPQLARAAKPHQIGGIRFLYDNVVESLEQFSLSPGFGCILAHSMGLGKTFQVCAFSEVFLRNTKARTVLVIVPINTIQNWVSEFNSWLPAERGPGEPPLDPSIQPRCFHLHVLNDSTKDFNSRYRVINDWSTQGGVLLIGYEMYRLFYTHRESKVKKTGPRKKKASGIVDLEEEEKEKVLLERIYQALVNPGPELVICDEGHRIKNMKTGIAVALKEIRTRRRVVLTGYPLQNNLLEYWCMVDFVRPNFLGTRTEFCNMFERPIQNGQCVDSSPADVKLMKERVYVLHSLVKGFVQRRSHAVLRNSLPHKEEHVLMLRLTPLQRALYRHHMSDLVQNKSVCNPLKAFAICLKIWNHPDVLYNFVKKSQDDVDLDLLDDETPENGRKKKKKNTSSSNVHAAAAVPTTPVLPPQPAPNAVPITDDEGGDGVDSTVHPNLPAGQGANSGAKEKKEELFTSMDWANELLKGYAPGDIENAAKTQIFFTILEESIRISDRLLVFSQSLFTLNLLEEFLQQRCIPGRQDEKWAKNRSYFRLDGSTNGMEREKLVNEFNANPDVLLFLISTRAGSLGINLIGANRVIVFDASWNPCHDAQAVCRVYRYGQKKRCYIYRFVTDNSLEKKIYDRQIGKQGTADRVVDELNPEARLSLKDVTSLVCDDEEDPPPKHYGQNLTQELSLADPILGLVLERWGSSFTKDPFQHDTLLAESKDSKLSKAEKRMAQRLYEKAKMDGTMQYRRQNYSAYYPKMPVPIPALDNGQGSNSPFNRVNPSYPTIRPSAIPGRPIINTSSQGMGMDMLAEALAQGKLVCKEMVLTKDVTIARNQMTNGTESSPIVLPVGTRVKLIRTPKGIYMQTPEGKIFRIHSSPPDTPGSPSNRAGTLGMGYKPPYSPTFSSSSPVAGGSKPPLMDQSMLKRLRDLKQRPAGPDGMKHLISFTDKNPLASQIRQNLLAGKGPSGSGKPGESQATSLPGKLSFSLPGSHSSLNQFAKQLAALAQKSAADSLADLIGGGSGSHSELESTTSSSNSGTSPIRPSSLLDPKARALPSASLPRKVATVSPNVSRARFFTPNRPLAAVEPVSKNGAIESGDMAASESSMLTPECPAPSALSALSALSASPMTAAPASLARISEMPTDMIDFSTKTDGGNSNNGRSGLFDNLSLASQLEGFASSTSKTTAPKAESLKDLLKMAPTSLDSTATTTTSAPNVNSQFQWNDGSTATSSANYQSWSEYPNWNNSWSESSVVSSNGNAATNWSTPNQWPSVPQQQVLGSDFTNSSGGGGGGHSTATTSSGVDLYNNHQQQYSNFGVNSQWPNGNFSNTIPTTGATTTSTTYPPADQYPGTTAPYFPANTYFNNATYGTYPQSGHPSFPATMSNFHLNQYSGHSSNNFTPGYSYPGSFSQ